VCHIVCESVQRALLYEEKKPGAGLCDAGSTSHRPGFSAVVKKIESCRVICNGVKPETNGGGRAGETL